MPGFSTDLGIPYALKYDYVSSTVSYLGVAAPGSASSAAVWQIKKIAFDTPATGDITITWADGNTDFDNIWDNRASLTYA